MMLVIMILYVAFKLTHQWLDSRTIPLIATAEITHIPSNSLTVQAQQSAGKSYLLIRVKEVRELKSGSDLDGTEEFRLLVFAIDQEQRFFEFTCPAEKAPVIVKINETFQPCQMGGFFLNEWELPDQMTLYLIGVDEDDLDLVSDVGSEVVVETVGTILMTFIAPEGKLGEIAFGAIVSLAGGNVKNYFTENDVIGSTTLILTRSNNWQIGTNQLISEDQGMAVTLDIQKVGYQPGTSPQETAFIGDEDQQKPISETPLTFLRDYYDNVTLHRCSEAYAMLSNRFKTEVHHNNYESYAQWCETINQADFLQQWIEGMNDEKAIAVVKIGYLFNTDPKNVHNANPMRFWLIKDPQTNHWLIDAADFTK
jgi:hypothetical protein